MLAGIYQPDVREKHFPEEKKHFKHIEKKHHGPVFEYITKVIQMYSLCVISKTEAVELLDRP